MKEYKYIFCEDINEYNGWEIIEIIENVYHNNMAIISKENKPIQDYIKLSEANNQQLIEELNKRLKKDGK